MWTFLTAASPRFAHGAAALFSGVETVPLSAALSSSERIEAALLSCVHAPHSVVTQLETLRTLAPSQTTQIDNYN